MSDRGPAPGYGRGIREGDHRAPGAGLFRGKGHQMALQGLREGSPESLPGLTGLAPADMVHKSPHQAFITPGVSAPGGHLDALWIQAGSEERRPPARRFPQTRFPERQNLDLAPLQMTPDLAPGAHEPQGA